MEENWGNSYIIKGTLQREPYMWFYLSLLGRACEMFMVLHSHKFYILDIFCFEGTYMIFQCWRGICKIMSIISARYSQFTSLQITILHKYFAKLGFTDKNVKKKREKRKCPHHNTERLFSKLTNWVLYMSHGNMGAKVVLFSLFSNLAVWLSD